LNLLKTKNIYDDSLIVVVSDHGQLLGEHGKMKHGTYLDDELLMVPLFVKYPDNIGKRISEKKDKQFISLKNLKAFILNGIKTKLFDDSILYSNIVFAESYGIHALITPKNKEEKRIVDELDKYRIAIFYRDHKAIFNVNDQSFDSIKSYSSSSTTSDITAKLRKEVLKILEEKIRQERKGRLKEITKKNVQKFLEKMEQNDE